MNNLDYISKLLEGKIVLGNKEEVIPNVYIIPVYKLKISFFNLSTDLKNNTGDGSSGSINVTPICLIQIKNDELKIVGLNSNKPDVLEGILPNLFSNVDINSILKNIRLEA